MSNYPHSSSFAASLSTSPYGMYPRTGPSG